MTKICTNCGLEKAKSDFYIRKASRDGLAYQCKSCHRAFEQTPQGKLIRNRAVRKYQATERGKEIALRSDRKRIGTPKRLISNRQAISRYRKTEHGRIMRYLDHHRRRDDKTFLNKEDIQNIYVKFQYRCFNCKTNQKLTIDHHYPLSRGYNLNINNAVLLCNRCNSSKKNKMPEEFYSPEQLGILNILGITKQ